MIAKFAPTVAVAAWTLEPSLALYASDGLHPSALATALAARVFYEQLTGREAPELTVGGATATELSLIRRAARLVQRRNVAGARSE